MHLLNENLKERTIFRKIKQFLWNGAWHLNVVQKKDNTEPTDLIGNACFLFFYKFRSRRVFSRKSYILMLLGIVVVQWIYFIKYLYL